MVTPLLKFLFLFFLSNTLAAEWNETFDENSRALAQALPIFKNQEYVKEYNSFTKARKKLLRDPSLQAQVQQMDPLKKYHVYRKEEGVILKKRRNNHIAELYVWELSYLLGSSAYMLPTFPFEISGKRVMMQHLEPFEFGHIKDGELLPTKILNKVSLETYWKAFLQAYILGLADLAGRNLGIRSDGTIRFFDTEASFSYCNRPTRINTTFTLGFICLGFDWPQYRMPLDRATAKKIQDFISSFSNFEKEMQTYTLYRPFIPEKGMIDRLQKVRTFPIQEGVTFRDFFGSIYPKMSAGLDELNNIVGRILQRKADHGTSLFYTCRWMRKNPPSPKDQELIQQWITRYVE